MKYRKIDLNLVSKMVAAGGVKDSEELPRRRHWSEPDGDDYVFDEDDPHGWLHFKVRFRADDPRLSDVDFHGDHQITYNVLTCGWRYQSERGFDSLMAHIDKFSA